MDIKDELIQIVEASKKEAIVPFLQKLSIKERKSLRSTLKKLNKEYMELFWVKKGNSTWAERNANEPQEYILNVCNFVCTDLKTFAKYNSNNFISKENLIPILAWGCPEWFGDFIFERNRFFRNGVDYDWMCELEEQGYVQPNCEFIAQQVLNISCPPFYGGIVNSIKFDFKEFTKREITLKEHIWYLFEYETPIHWSWQKDWIAIFVELAKHHYIDRTRLIKVTLGTANHNFKQNLINWFVKLFEALEVSNDELLNLQEDLFNVFHSPHSKAVNIVLKAVKNLAKEDAFDANAFLEHIPNLLASETKSVVNSSLMILDKLAKKYKTLAPQICQIACQALMHTDDKIQMRAAKLIKKYGDLQDETLCQEIGIYQDNLLYDTQNLLSHFLKRVALEESINEIENYQKEAIIREDNYIPALETFDDFVFLASQAFNQNEANHFDLLLGGMVRFAPDVNKVKIEKLMPAFQRAYKIRMTRWSPTTGYLTDLLANIFIDFGQLLVAHFPESCDAIVKIHMLNQKEDNKFNRNVRRLRSLKHWSTNASMTTFCKTHKELGIQVLEKIKNQGNLPLLSTPTHHSFWIDPIVFVERLHAYQVYETKPLDIDFQIALSRLALDHTQNALELAKEKLTGEYLQLMEFMLQPEALPPKQINAAALWMSATLSKNPKKIYSELDHLEYQNKMPRHFLDGQFNWYLKLEKSFLGDRVYKSLAIEINPPKKKNVAKGLGLSYFFHLFKKDRPYFLYENLWGYGDGAYFHHNDVKRFLGLLPNNPEPLLAIQLEMLAGSGYKPSTGEHARVEQLMEALLEQKAEYKKMAHIAIAAGMFYCTQTVQMLAAEAWVKGVYEERIQSGLVGEIQGKLTTINYAPLKRLTDLIANSMLNVSATHNLALQNLIEHCILNMSAKPITNTKKLLDIYYELLAKNKTQVQESKIWQQLEYWKVSGTLKKVIGGIEKINKNE